MRKLATAAFSFSAGIFISRYVLPNEHLLLGSALIALVSLCAFFFQANIRLRIFIITLSISSALLWSRLYFQINVLPAYTYHGNTATATATVSNYPQSIARGYRVDVKISQNKAFSVAARLYYNGEANLIPGDTIEFTARFLRTDDTSDDRQNALSSKGAFLAAYATSEISVLSVSGKFRQLPLKISHIIAHLIEKLYPSDVSPFMSALLVGVRDKLNNDSMLTTALAAAGISHIVAISGMHISFLMGFLSLFVKNKSRYAYIAIPLLFLFMAMTGFTPSVTRAGVMQLFLISAGVFKRQNDGLTSISTALMLLLAANPYSISSVSLQLSFASTLGIILFTSNIHYALSDNIFERKSIKNKAAKSLLTFIIASLSTTIGALVFTLPLSAIHFGMVSLIAPISNLLVLWAVSIAFPLGLFSSIIAFLYLPLGAILAYPISYIARYIIFLARAFASVPFFAVYSSNTLVMFWLSYVYMMFFALPLLRARMRQYIYPCCISAVLLFVILLVSPLLPRATVDSITVLDVGQGLSVILRSREHTVVVDCGSSSGENAGFITHEYLSNLGETTIDLLILTHFHEDHANGVEYLFARTHISTLAIPDPEDSYLAKDIIDLARKSGTEIIYVITSLRIPLGNFEICLYPPIGEMSENEQGISILSLGSPSALITGDMASPTERALLRYAFLPDIDVLVVGHHGSRFSTSYELLQATTPEIAVIPVGKNNYGHPAEQTLSRLEEHSITIYRTDTMGNITITN
ncbi:MAG: DNA internalization-related competence protein ComEC/Rec2 [Oscillospiraceae bacterium]|nr:DNA internalization-related competence protein ComEC/Rec2 [Oscillospiraceae bacterium]